MKILFIKGTIIDSHNYAPEKPHIENSPIRSKNKLHKRWHKYLNSIKKRVRPLYRSSKTNSPSFIVHLNHEINLKGIIYTAVFNPYDGRKNWFDMVTAFCSAFIDTEDALLILKFTHHNNEYAFAALKDIFRKLRPFKCRVIAIHGFLDDEEYNSLITNSTYVVNTSFSEGQCLPLMEFLSSGKPAVTPCHTAMEDYICDEVAFIINSEPELCTWPHDTRQYFRTHRYHLSYQSLIKAYNQSYNVAKYQPARYRQMSEKCKRKLKNHCSIDVSLKIFNYFLQQHSRLNLQDESTPADFF